MSRKAVQELAAQVGQRYAVAGRRENTRMLDEFCANTGMHRNAALRLLGRRPGGRPRPAGRPALYSAAATVALVRVWESADRMCGKLLTAVMCELVDGLVRHGELSLTPEVRAELLAMSPATVDRRLRRERSIRRQPERASAAVPALRQEVPVRTWSEWEAVAPGELQADLVLHCGGRTAGSYLCTLVAVDAATGWVTLQPLRSLSAPRVGDALHFVQGRFPVPVRSLHTDNGSEFINHVVVPWCRRSGIRLSRGRAYRKNDQARVEQKNWIAVRRQVGYERYAGDAAYAVLKQLYPLLELQLNLLRPVRRLVAKERVGARTRKRYDQPATPFQRMLASGQLSAEVALAGKQQLAALNPAALQRRIERSIAKLVPLAVRPSQYEAVG